MDQRPVNAAKWALYLNRTNGLCGAKSGITSRRKVRVKLKASTVDVCCFQLRIWTNGCLEMLGRSCAVQLSSPLDAAVTLSNGRAMLAAAGPAWHQARRP